MDANLLRRFLSMSNQFNVGRVTYDGDTVVVEGDESVYSSSIDEVEELEEQIRKDKEMEG